MSDAPRPAGAARRSGGRPARIDRVAAARERRELRATVDDPQVVLDAAAALLAIRPRTVVELRRRLRGAGYRDLLVTEVLERLAELGYVDDASFARAWVESRDRSRPRGERALRDELAQRGVPAELVRAVLAERAESLVSTHDPEVDGSPDLDAARRLLERRRGSLSRESDPRRRAQRAYALLARNGFAPDVCSRAIREADLMSE